jgi:NAD(P)-dependent dehydrogenase (short-subunit alcohol dehydrogenase family)
MELELKDKVAVVTGANRGIGEATARGLAAEGARVVAGSRSTDNLDAIEGVTAVAVDLAESGGAADLVKRAIDEHGRIDVLVNNVGALRVRTEGFLGTSDADFEWAMKMNFYIALEATRAAMPTMVEQGSGSIVNVASLMAFFQPDPGTIDYGAAKAALVNLTKTLSQEFGPAGVRINAVSPGPVGTDMWFGAGGVAETIADASGIDSEQARAEVAAGIPTGRFSTPEEVASLVLFLASTRSLNVTGSNFVIDGGIIKTT